MLLQKSMLRGWPALVTDRASHQVAFQFSKAFLNASYSTAAANYASSIALRKLPKWASKSEIEAFIQKDGIEIKRMRFIIDRFSLVNKRNCFVEVGDAQQAQKAISFLNGTELMNEQVSVEPLRESFVWDYMPPKEQGETELSHRCFDAGETSPSEVLKPILEGRRMLLSVQAPGWGDPHSTKNHNTIARNLVKQHFGPHGLESMSHPAPFFGDLKPEPRLLCLLDFATKDGAQQAQQAYHDTEIEGRKIWLQPSVPAPWIAHQIGKYDAALLAELQEKGLAPTETYENKFVSSKSKKKNKKKRTKRRTEEAILD